MSIAGPVVLGPLSDVLNVDATHGNSSLPVTIPITVDSGANAAGEAYRIDWDGGSGTDITGAYGVLPSILSRTYANPGNGNTDTHNLVITYRNDHGSSATLRIRVIVHGA